MHNKKAQEYQNMLRSKSNEDLLSTRKNLVEKLKAEKAKGFPDKSIAHNYKWQLSMIDHELKRRKPADRMSQVEGDNAKPDDASSLTKKTLDELKSMLSSLKKKLEEYKGNNDGKKLIVAQVTTVEKEIAVRDPKAHSDAKKDLEKSEGKWLGLDRDVIQGGVVGAVIGLASSLIFGGNKIGWTLVGAGVGSGYTYFTRTNPKGATVVSKPNV